LHQAERFILIQIEDTTQLLSKWLLHLFRGPGLVRLYQHMINRALRFNDSEVLEEQDGTEVNWVLCGYSLGLTMMH